MVFALYCVFGQIPRHLHQHSPQLGLLETSAKAIFLTVRHPELVAGRGFAGANRVNDRLRPIRADAIKLSLQKRTPSS